jgi:hypothetical protein
MTTKTRPATPPPSLLDDDQYRRATAQLADLKTRAATLERRREELALGLTAQAKGAALAARARHLLDDAAVPAARVPALRENLAGVLDEQAITAEAIRLQQAVVDRELARASAGICERLQPQHRAIVRRIAASISELRAALGEELDFRNALIETGISFTAKLRPMPLANLVGSDPRDENNVFALWMADARSNGLLD